MLWHFAQCHSSKDTSVGEETIMSYVEEPGKATTTGEQKNQEAVRPATSSHAPEVSPPHDAALENERLLLFSDGIIAFTITLATISIRLPVGKDAAELPTLLTELFPKLLTYLIGFVIVGSYWYEHWRLCRYIKRSTTAFVVRNLLFLASLVFLPFLSHFYGGNFYLSGDRESLHFYLGITTLVFYTFLLVTGFLLWLIWRYASRTYRLIDEDLTPSMIRNTTVRLFRVPLAIIVYLVAFEIVNVDILYSFLAVMVFLAIWEGLRHFLLRHTPALQPTDTHRLVIFSDCVMAIAITLVAAQLELPELQSPHLTGTGTNVTLTGSLAVAAGHLSLILFIYLVAFLNIGIHWMSHYHMFRSIKRSNAFLAMLNFAFLLCITLLFIPTSASIQYGGVFASRFYYLAQTITASLLVLMWVYAVQKHRLLDESADPARIRRTTWRLLRNLLIFAALAVLTFVLPIPMNILIYFVIYLLVEMTTFVIRRIRHLFERRKLSLAEMGKLASSKK
jgi:uncharacterized membrane protein